MVEAAMTTTPLLRMEGVSKHYGDTVALSSVSLSLMKGQTLAIIGRSGSGKTTVQKCISCLELPTFGSISLNGTVYVENGELATDEAFIRRKIVSVLQGGHLFPSMTGLRNLVFTITKARQVPHAMALKLSTAMAGALGVKEVLDRFPDEMSGGQAQRLALARALLLAPEVLLLDEVTSSLDPATTTEVIQALRNVRRFSAPTGMGIVFSTHLLRFAFEFADNVAFLDNGQLVECHPAREFASLCQSESARAFVAANIMPF